MMIADTYEGTQCARCGSTCAYEHCTNCEDGFSHHDCGEDVCCCLDDTPNVPCDICGGKGGWWVCLSSFDWCDSHALPGHENVPRGAVVHFSGGTGDMS